MATLPSCLTDIGKRQIVARGHSLGLLAKWTVRWANASNKQRFATYSGLLLLSGCGYTVGNGFSPDIRTVSVPIFENATFRRGIEVQITEAVQKEIQKRTPYRLAKGLDADTRLTGRTGPGPHRQSNTTCPTNCQHDGSLVGHFGGTIVEPRPSQKTPTTHVRI